MSPVLSCLFLLLAGGSRAADFAIIFPMIWRPPEQIEQHKRALWRAVVVWGLLGVLVAIALGVQVAVTQAARVDLGPRVSSGRLSAQMPQGWGISTDSGPFPRIWAEYVEGESDLVLNVRLVPIADGPPSAADFLVMHYRAQEAEPPRRVEVAGAPGALVSYDATMEIVGTGIRRGLQVTAAAGQVDMGTFVHIELRRFGGAGAADAVLVRQVARTVQVSKANDEEER